MGTSLAQAGGRTWETEPTPAAPRRRHPWRRWVWLLGVVAGLAVWQALWQSRAVPEYMLPAPAAVAAKWLVLWRAGILWHHIAATLKEALLGFGVAFVVGVGLGYPLARSDALAGVLAPYVAATQAMPVIAFAPLLVVWFGLGLLPKVIICALIVFFPILVNTITGIRGIDPALREVALVYGASRAQTVRLVELPLALPTLLSGVKIGFTLAVTGATVAEFIGASRGLGLLLNVSKGLFDTPLLFVALVTLIAMAIVAFGFVSLLERLLIRW